MKTLRACAFALAMTITPAVSAAQEVPTARVGMITTLSGGGKGLGINVRDGFLLAVEMNQKANLEVVVEDDERSVDRAQAIADGMLQRGDIDFYTGIIWSNILLSVGPGIFESGHLYLSPNAGPAHLAGLGCHPNYFNVAWQNDNLHEAVGNYMRNQGFEFPFILAPDYPAGHVAMTGFKRFMKADELAGEVLTKLGQKDYSVEIEQIRNSGADSVFFFLPGGMGIHFLKQYREADIGKIIYGPAFSFDQTILAATGAAALGVLNASQWSPDIDYPANTIFVEAFVEKFGRIPSLYASQGYDTANLLIEALAIVRDPTDIDGMHETMMRIDFGSTRGPFRFAENQHPTQDIIIRQVVERDGVITNVIKRYALTDWSNSYVRECPYVAGN